MSAANTHQHLRLLPAARFLRVRCTTRHLTRHSTIYFAARFLRVRRQHAISSMDKYFKHVRGNSYVSPSNTPARLQQLLRGGSYVSPSNTLHRQKIIEPTRASMTDNSCQFTTYLSHENCPAANSSALPGDAGHFFSQGNKPCARESRPAMERGIHHCSDTNAC